MAQGMGRCLRAGIRHSLACGRPSCSSSAARRRGLHRASRAARDYTERLAARASSEAGGGGQAPMDPEKMKEILENDPELRSRMEEMQKVMADPTVQEQMQQAAATMESPQFKASMEALKDDPELKDVFEELKTGGMPALMKYWNDPEFLGKLAEKMGAQGVPSPAGQPPPEQQPPQQQQQGAPEIYNLIDACKYGDLEAAEDYIAIGKDVNERDGEQRTPLHFAAGSGSLEVVKVLLEAGADVDAQESKLNTPLHYATGYGRVDIARALLDAGAKTEYQNANGKPAVDLVELNPNNPIFKEKDLMKQLKPSKSKFVDIE